ncbi:MAG: hypothetical protein HGB11_15430, partial [Chlorobiales bacterium]|nr:hypothetical protein [Chlorobiales bacterium]
MKNYFAFDQHQTSFKQEIVAGFTTFVTMSYIIIVNPAILQAAGMPRDASMTATILTAIFGTLVMGIYAKRPFAIAPYMGENAFIAFGLVAMGARSQYLVHGVESDRFAGPSFKGNPYPSGDERATINAAFDELVKTLQTKRTDKGVALFKNDGKLPDFTLANPNQVRRVQAETIKAA